LGKEYEMKKEWVARELTMEVVVGAFMVMVLLGMGYFTIILSKENIFTSDRHKIEVVFKNIMGLSKGDRVVVRGMAIGKVNGFHLKPDGVHVHATLEQSLNLRTNYTVSVVTASVLGGRYLEVNEGSADCPEVGMNTVLHGQDPFDLVADAAVMINSLKNGLTEGEIVENLKKTMAEIREIADRLSAGKGTLGKLLSEDDKLYNDLADTVASLKNVTTRMDKGEGTLGKLLSADDKLYDDLSDSVASLKNITASIEKGEGMLGKMVKDEKLYNDIQSIVKEARATIDDFRETAPITTFSSIFFGAF